jgi:quercetin dioxygenase-like cupin family protein
MSLYSKMELGNRFNNRSGILKDVTKLKVVKLSEAPSLETVKGRHGVILQSGEKAMMMMLTVECGVQTPPHSHPHEQVGYLLEGRGVLFSGGQSKEIEAGTSFLIPSNESHSFNATGKKPAIIIDVFSPPRQDYLEKAE